MPVMDLLPTDQTEPGAHQTADDWGQAARDVVSRLLARLKQTVTLLERHRQLRL